MTTHNRTMNTMKLATILALAFACAFPAAPLFASAEGVVPVEVVEQDGRFQLLRGGQPFTVHGAGLEFTDISVFAAHGVSIRVAEQEGNGPDARLVFITHTAREADVQATVRDLRDLDVVHSIGGLLRVIGD